MSISARTSQTADEIALKSYIYKYNSVVETQHQPFYQLRFWKTVVFLVTLELVSNLCLRNSSRNFARRLFTGRVWLVPTRLKIRPLNVYNSEAVF